jgi:thiamine pyrophosphate-dependent acetolactate synthase large subunit-like protein
MLLCASELASAVNSQTPCVVILLINRQLGNRTEDSLIGKSSKLPKVDWQIFVEALGANYAPIEGSPSKSFLEGLLRKTKEERMPVVIPMNISLETEYIYTLKTGLSVLDDA